MIVKTIMGLLKILQTNNKREETKKKNKYKSTRQKYEDYKGSSCSILVCCEN